MSRTSGRRIEDIEVLRAVAVAMVVFHHGSHLLAPWRLLALDRLYSWVVGGHGVDLFFAISGFVIARDLLPRLEAARIAGRGHLREASAFWTRRVFRLLPSAWLCLAITVGTSALLNRSGAFGSLQANAWGALAALLQVANLYFPFHFASERGLGATYHFWSLSLEEQFYLCLPLLACLRRRTLVWVMGGLAVVQLLSTRPTFLHWMLRTDAMFLGVLLAMWSATPGHAAREPRWLAEHRLAGPLALVALCTVVVTANSPHLQSFRYGLSAVAIASVLLVLIASWDRGHFVPRGLPRRSLLWIGSRSYAIYLWHVPVFALVREVALRNGHEPGALLGAAEPLALGVAALVVLGLLSECNFRLVETPLRKRGIALAARLTETP